MPYSLFKQRLEETAANVESVLDTLLDEQTARSPRVMTAMRYAVLNGGKRLRPFLVVECARLTNADPTGALRIAAALECVHCYSLVHDDLPAMDDDDLRRGRPTAHVKFDEATAILAGDGLLSLAFEILSGEETHPDPAIRIRLIRDLAVASGANGMVGGQMLDLEAEKTPQDTNGIIAMQSLKTGRLFEYACQSGAILGGADEAACAALRNYASKIGLAFQVADDLLDVESTAEDMGKQTGKDAESGKATFVSLMGAENARHHARNLIDDAVNALAVFGDRGDALKQAAKFIIERKY